MKNLKILLLFVLLSVFFYAELTTADEEPAEKPTQKTEEKIIWKNPLPTLIQQLKHRAEEILDELNKDFPDFPFQDFDAISLQVLDNLISEIDEEIDQICLLNNEEAAKAVTVLIEKQRKIYRLENILYEHEKYDYFRVQGEEYIKKLEEFGWIIHYHDPEIFRKILSQFYDSRYRSQIDKELNINFERLVIFGSDDLNCLITGIIKYDNQAKENKFREDMVAFYFRGHLNDPMDIFDSEVFELRWLDSEGQKHIVWHPVMPYPFPIPLIVRNSLY